MKLEGELAFFPSHTGLEPESQSFEFNDNDLDSAGYKLQNQKVKQYENRVSSDFKRSEQDSDLSTHNMESADCMTRPELDFSNSMIDSKNDYEAQIRDFVDPLSQSSNDIETVMKLPNDIESVKRSATSPVANPPDKIDSFEKSVDVYMDKSVTECEPEMVVCYRESSYVVKDICVDEGIPKMDKVLFEKNIDEKAYNSVPSESYDDKEMKKDNNEINGLNLPPAEEPDHVSANHDQSKDMMHKDEDVTEKLSGNVNKEMVLPGDKVLQQELHAQQLDTQESRLSDDKGEQVSGEPESHSRSVDSKNMTEEAVLATQVSGELESYSLSVESKNVTEEAVLASHTAAVGVDESSGDSILLENGTFSYEFGPSAPVACGKEECHQVGSCKCDETQTSWPLDGVADGRVVTSHDRHSLGESSFSAVGPVSGRISYSGPVPYSGSISLRSDSSTTSTRSFAFPILQSEWNSSPVRMAKADKRKCRKHRGWRHGLLCCRF